MKTISQAIGYCGIFTEEISLCKGLLPCLGDVRHEGLNTSELYCTSEHRCRTTNLTVVGQPGDVWGSEVR